VWLRAIAARRGHCSTPGMAHIATSRVGDLTQVTVTGSLSAEDTGLLEHACAPALVEHPSPLEIDVRGVTYADRIAAALLSRMRERGARIIGIEGVAVSGESRASSSSSEGS
jgi:hypothetical protein